MAGNLPLLNGVEMKLRWDLSGTPFALNILHFNNASAAVVNQTLANAVSSSVKTAYTGSGLAVQQPTTIALATVSIRSMTANSDPWFEGAGAPVAGSSTANPLPAANCLVVTLRTALRGRSFMGRTYIAGFSEDANDAAGGATPAAAAASSTFLSTILTSLQGATPSLVMGVVSRYTRIPGSAVSTERNPPIITPVVATPTDQRWDVQRRRARPGI